jgi:hypothetical protein
VSLYEKAAQLRAAEIAKGKNPGPHHRTAYLSRRLIRLLEAFALSQKQVRQLLRQAESMARGKGAPKLTSTQRKYELVCLYKAEGLKWEAIADEVNNLTGCTHDSSYYRKLLRRRTSVNTGH